MAEYWKSNPKKHCDFCKVWIADNKASISIHEQGKQHKDKVKAKLVDIKKRSIEKQSEDRKMNATMAAIERAAAQAMEKDLTENPRMKNQYGASDVSTSAALAIAQATATAAASSIVNIKKDDKKKKKEATVAAQAQKRPNEVKKPESKIGEWKSIEKKPKIEPVIDLNLPSANKMVKQLKMEAERELKEDFKSLNEEIDKKSEAIAEASSDVPSDTKDTLVTEKPPQPTEKIVTLGSSSSSSRPVMFKKRKIEGQQSRQRTDD